VLREYTNKEGLSPISLHITGNKTRERFYLDIHVDPKQFDKVKQRLKATSDQNRDVNLVLDTIDAKITGIKTVYRLSEKVLTPILLLEEFRDGLPRVNFVAFFKQVLDVEFKTMHTGTFRRYKSVHAKLKEYKPEIYFTDINEEFFLNYRRYLKTLGNRETTINSNIITIKKYLRIGQKKGIKIGVDLDDVKSGSTKGNRTSLNQLDLVNLYNYYNASFITDHHKLVLGYFLFGCMTGLRISDIQKIERKDLMNNDISFISTKTRKDQVITLNIKAREIVKSNPNLFITKVTNEYMNRAIKNICAVVGITKQVSFHVARHTFATCFLRMGGSVEKLQILLGHSDIKETMIYVHIVGNEANKEIFLLDNLF
jgi:site-specific recombinase XerD